MGVVAHLVRSGLNVQRELFTARDHLIQSAVNEVDKVKGDTKHLPFNLMQIFKRYATDPLAFSAEESTEQFSLDFITEVLGRFWDSDKGSFSRVYFLDGKHVLKVNCVDGHWSPKDGCFGWLKVCTGFQHNPYAPKLMAMEQEFHLYFAVMESLEFGVGLGFDNGCLGDLSFESYHPDFDVTAYTKDGAVPFGFKQFVLHCPASAVEIARGFESYREDVGGVEDISQWNVMHRQGFPVLTDPICDVMDGMTDLESGTSFSWMSKD